MLSHFFSLLLILTQDTTFFIFHFYRQSYGYVNAFGVFNDVNLVLQRGTMRVGDLYSISTVRTCTS